VGAVMVTSTRVALSPSIPRSAAMAGSRCGASTSAGSAFGARAGIASFRCTWASHDHRAVAVRSDLRQEFCDIGVGGRAVAPDIERGRYRAWRHGPYPDRRAERSVLGPHRGAAPLETASIEAVSQDDAAARWMPSRNAPAKATHGVGFVRRSSPAMAMFLPPWPACKSATFCGFNDAAADRLHVGRDRERRRLPLKPKTAQKPADENLFSERNKADRSRRSARCRDREAPLGTAT
jgi:hypothetical protein